MVLPDRLSKLMSRIEAGGTVTQQDVDRVAQLQALDIAKAGEDFVRERVAAEHEYNKMLGME